MPRILRSAVVGAALCAAVQTASLAWTALARASDTATTRVAESVAGALGESRVVFALALILGVAFGGALAGGAHGLLRWWAARPDSQRPGLWAELGWTVAIVGLWLLGRWCAAPALLAPALPDSHVLDWLASHASPWMFQALMGALALAAVLVGVRRRRITLAALRPRRRTAILLATLAGATALALGSSRALRRQPSGRTNVLILAADSVRTNHLSALGYRRPTTPHLDGLAAQGALFERAMSPIARTTPAWLSILTGRYPHGHGIRHMFPSRALRPRSLPTVPRAFAEAGYRTAVFSDYAGDFFPTFDLGFARQRVPPPLNLRTVFETQAIGRSPLAIAFLAPLPEALRPHALRYLMNNADPERIADEVIAELDGEQPFFTVAFFSAPHVPFASPWPHWRTWAAPDYRGEHRYQYDVAGLSGLARSEAALPAADVAQVVALYDGALRAVDHSMGRILTELSRRGLHRSTLVVFLSDHGENLFEPGQTTLHGKWFRGGDEANRTPLILRGPGVQAGVRVRQSVSLVDLAPTLGELLEVRVPPSDGRSLSPALRGGSLPPFPVFAETGLWLNGGVSPDGLGYPSLLQLLETDERSDGGQIVLAPRFEDVVVAAKHRTVWSDPWKLIYEPTRTGVRVQLYDLSRDPGQTTDLAGQEPGTAARLLRDIRLWMSQDRERRLDPVGHMARVGG